MSTAITLTNNRDGGIASAGSVVRQQRKLKWGFIEIFVLIQFLSGALLFLPGAQSVRLVIRALPYLSSLGLLIYYIPRRSPGRYPLYAVFLVFAVLLLFINLAHPNTPVESGFAQCIFQFSIMAPAFWVGKIVREREHLSRLLWIIFLANSLGAAVGVLQVYYPDLFLPSQFSSQLADNDESYLQSLSYTGAEGQTIYRPPGLTDLPGGAAIAGLFSALFGLSFAVRSDIRKHYRAACLAAAVVGMAALYLTQVRSLLVMLMIGLITLSLLALRQKKPVEAVLIVAFSAALVVGGFIWAVSVGGESISARFLDLYETGITSSYQANRGYFVNETIDTYLPKYPLGAGLGRWGMMSKHFYRGNHVDTNPIYVEIQMTGWLLDGGVFMWLFYGGAILCALFYSFTSLGKTSDPIISPAARIIFCFQLALFGMSFSGPTFNSQSGIQFWMLTAALFGVVTTSRERKTRLVSQRNRLHLAPQVSVRT
ncbi:MAG: hypothetical protein ACRD63_00640 [Pyrinomonadaceae bacterium]